MSRTDAGLVPSCTSPMVRDRPLDTEADWWRVRAMLLETATSVPRPWNWDIRRWDGWRFHREVPLRPDELAFAIRLWESPDGTLVGVAHPEGSGEAFLEVRPDARDIEEPMFAWAEQHLAATGSDGVRRLEMAVLDDDAPRRRLLGARGYEALEAGVWWRRLDLGRWSPAPVGSLPTGVEFRTTRRDAADAGRMATLLNRAFGRTIHTAAEYRTFMERSPSFDERLNLVATAADGSFACHIAFTIDPVNEVAILEPVATDPDHRRRGLARLLIDEGLRRVVGVGARTATVETGHAPAGNALYEACGFSDARHLTIWRKTIAGT